MRQIILLMTLAVMLSGCVIEEPGPGPGHERWCYWHPYRCRLVPDRGEVNAHSVCDSPR